MSAEWAAAIGRLPLVAQESFVLDLPWLKPPLSLNDRGQTPGARQQRSRITAEVKAEVVTLAKAAKIGPQSAIHVRLHWRVPTKHRRDPDNLVATLKPCIDALVVAGIVPDDCPPFVDWSAPRIHPPAEDRKPAMWLEVTPTPCLLPDITDEHARRLIEETR